VAISLVPKVASLEGAIEEGQRPLREERLRHEYLFEHATLPVLCAGIAKRFGRYNGWRLHEGFGNLTPAAV
jgi:hypothetical protein